MVSLIKTARRSPTIVLPPHLIAMVDQRILEERHRIILDMSCNGARGRVHRRRCAEVVAKYLLRSHSDA